MSNAIIIHQFGGAEQLGWESVTVPDPAKGEVQVRHTAIGLNFIDVYHRTGLYPLELPFVPGQEAAGVVEAVGEGVEGFEPGQRVCYQGVTGAYAEVRNVPAQKLMALPDDISDADAAATLLKGLTVCYLLEMTWKVKSGETILFHAAAGGVGQIAVQWAKALGARVIGTVGSDEKAQIVTDLGIDHVINLRTEDFTRRTRELTGGNGVDVVYDSIGKDTFESSLDCLKPRGLMVSFGNSSGPVSVPNLGILAGKGSLYVTRPTLGHYFDTPDAEREGVQRVFEMIRNGTIKVDIGQKFALAEAAKAHTALENRETTGATLLIP